MFVKKKVTICNFFNKAIKIILFFDITQKKINCCINLF